MDGKGIARTFGEILGVAGMEDTTPETTRRRHEREQDEVMQRAASLMEQAKAVDACEIVEDCLQLPTHDLRRKAVVIPVPESCIDPNVLTSVDHCDSVDPYSLKQFFVVGMHDLRWKDGSVITVDNPSLDVATVYEFTSHGEEDNPQWITLLEQTNPGEPVLYPWGTRTDFRHAIHGESLDVPLDIDASHLDGARLGHEDPDFWEKIKCALDQIEEALNALDVELR